MNRARGAIGALMFGNFAIGTGVVVVPGMLTDLARGLGVSVPTAGQLIALAAFVTAVAAPLAAAFTSRIDRRVLLVGSLVLYTAGLAASAFAPGYASLAVLRMISVLAAAVFTPQAAATIALMVPPAQRAGAVSAIFLGWSVASVLGMPFGNVIGAYLGWRWAFGASALLSSLAMVWVARTIPGGLAVPTLSAADWRSVAGNRLLMGVLTVTLVSAAGQFTVIAYVAPLLAAATQAPVSVTAALLMLFGAFGVIGNTLMVRHINRVGPDRAVAISFGAIVVGVCFAMLVTLALGAPRLGASEAATRWMTWPLLLATCLTWGLGCFAMNSAQQARLAAIAPTLASASIALNSSCMYGGQAIGAAIGGALIGVLGLASLPWAAALLLVSSLVLSLRLRTH